VSTSPIKTRRQRYYTLAEARRALPLVRSIVRDITETVAQFKSIKQSLLVRERPAGGAARRGPGGSEPVARATGERQVTGREPDRREADRREAAERDLADCEDRLRALRVELATLGVEIKDLASGLVDFRCRHEGRDVWICWRHGEADIGFWHELEAGFAGRKPISQLVAAGEAPSGLT